MGNKSFYRCTVCNDIHFGAVPPNICPTCSNENAYVPVEPKEALMVQFQQKSKDPQIKFEDLRKIWEDWTRDKDFKLNPDKAHTDMAIKGGLENEKKTGLKYCPCRLRTRDFEKDLQLICPCNFKTHATWNEKGMCWCGLFVKR